MTTYTTELKQKLREDIRFIDDHLDSARGHMVAGNKGEAQSLLDGLLEYYDFKKHFPDIFINEDESMRFMDMYEALRSIDDIIEIDAGDIRAGTPREWRPGYTRDQILQRLYTFLDQIDAWLRLNWFEGEEIRRSLEVLKEKIKAFIRYFENDGDFSWTPSHDVREAKKALWRALSENLPFAEVYELLMSMDRNLYYLVFRFRLHLDELTPEAVEGTIEELAQYKHSILAIINATRSDDEILTPPPAEEDGPIQRPSGWDDLQPFPPAGYAFFGGSIVPIQASRRTGEESVGIAVEAGNSRSVLVSGLLGFVLGVVAASILAFLLFSANCPPG